MDVHKIVVVGPPKAGKSSLINAFLKSDDTLHSTPRQHKDQARSSPTKMDFVLKILTIGEEKVRV